MPQARYDETVAYKMLRQNLPEQFIDAVEHVVVVGRFRGKAKNGVTLDAPFVHVYRMRNGKAVFFQNYVDATRWANAWGA